MLQRTKNPSSLQSTQLFPEHPLLDNAAGKGPNLDHLPRELRELVACIHQNLFDPDLDVKKARGLCRIRNNNIACRFRRAMGMGIKRYIVEHRMGAARTLLLTSDLSIFDVAMEVGYVHVETFYQVFQRHFGCTPGQLRTGTPSPPSDNAAGKGPNLDHLPRELRELVACIHQNLFDPDLDVKKVRELCRIRDNNIAYRFRRAMGMGITRYIDGHRMGAARTLLLTSDLSIFDVAMEVGYVHVETFYQVFQRHFGCTPGQLRTETENPG